MYFLTCVEKEKVMELSQILALLIFLIMFAVIIWGKVHRYIPALLAGIAVILFVFLLVMRSPHAVVNVLNLEHFADLAFWNPGRGHWLQGLALSCEESMRTRASNTVCVPSCCNLDKQIDDTDQA